MGTRVQPLIRFIVLSVALVAPFTRPAEGSPIPAGSGSADYYDLRFSVASSIVLVPGETGFLRASIENIGTLSVVFPPYDTSNPIGGYGWNFNDPGLAIGVGGVGVGSSSLAFTEGHVEPVVRQPFSCCYGTPNFSNLSNVMIDPGDSLTFDLLSMMLDPGVAPDLAFVLDTNVTLNFGSPIFAGFRSSPFFVDVSAGDSFANSPLTEVALTNFAYPNPPGVPEPSSLLLVGGGVVGFLFRRREAKRDRG